MDPADLDLVSLRHLWLEGIRPGLASSAPTDPFLSGPNVDSLLLRFLDAERGPAGPKRQSGEAVVRRAAQRLENTAAFRHEYDCVGFHRKGAARRLFMHKTNCGASVYFGDCGLRATDGTLVLIGRAALMMDERAPGRKPSDAMLPAQHLRAMILVVERAAVALMEETGRVAKGAYILDVGSYPTEEMGKHSAGKRYWDLDGEPSVSGKKGHEPCAGPSLPGHHGLGSGMRVLKEAMRIMERHYPETLHTVYFYRPGMTFRLAFAIFRLWVPKSTRDRFILVREGEENVFFEPQPRGCGLRREEAPVELGGTGASLEGDLYLLKSCSMYDATASLEDRLVSP